MLSEKAPSKGTIPQLSKKVTDHALITWLSCTEYVALMH